MGYSVYFIDFSGGGGWLNAKKTKQAVTTRAGKPIANDKTAATELAADLAAELIEKWNEGKHDGDWTIETENDEKIWIKKISAGSGVPSLYMYCAVLE
jgi:hypothetical protein